MSIKSLAYCLVVMLAVASSAEAWWFSPEPAAPAQAPQSAATQDGPVRASANFDMAGVRGNFRFSQKSPSEATIIEYDLQGLQGNNKLFHVHVKPVPAFEADKVRNNATAIAQLCADPSTGGHLNPHHITEKLPPKSAPLDKYEIGDLSGKHGALVEVAGHKDHYVGTFNDNKLPLMGPNGIIGRSLVIHQNDGKRWVCANIVETKA